ncbi:MAG: UPF0175 family protein [Candidatus Thermoplasmatota archaeon]|nr:UPF0175 family protein [Candidatus Thermoplasmatota archaeon]MBU4190147.1 UPF0175 family protein [Candidatus Thermoplasmatota archaeon]MCG2827588.1 UPF0175 family protein [Thermoplasmatales archaeon]
MGATITTRVSDNIAQEIKIISNTEHLDKSAVVRRLLVDAIRRWRVENALKQYAKGGITLWKAAENARISLREMIEYASEKDISFQYTVDDLREDFEELK